MSIYSLTVSNWSSSIRSANADTN